MSDDEKYLILGASRGGTTLLAAALGAHPDVAMLDQDMDAAFNKIIGGKVPGVKLCVPNHIELDKRWNPLFSLGMKGGFLRKSMFMNRIPKSRFSIRDYDDFGTIRHICILRHPAGVIPSIMKRERRSLAVASYRWMRCVDVFRALDVASEYDPIFVSFEDFVRQPEVMLKSLCAQLKLDFSSQMIEAPTRNARYRSSQFDPKRAEYEEYETIWENLPKDAPDLYKSVYDKRILPL